MISSELNFRGTAPTVQDTLQVRNVAIPPLPGWERSDQNIMFSVPASDREWISSQFSLDMEFAVTKANGDAIDANIAAAFLNLPIASFFQSVRLTLNGVTTEGLDNNWQTRSWLTSILSLSYISKKYYGKDLFKYVPDSPNQAQSLVDATNTGFAVRKALCANSQHVHVRTPIPFSFSTCNLAIPTGVPIEICLVNSPEQKRIMSNVADLKITFYKLRLLVRYMLLNPTINSTLLENVITVSRGEIPELIMIGIRPAALDALTWDANWMDLQANGLSFVQAEVDGQFYPQDGYSVDFDTSVGTYELFDGFKDVCRLLSGDGSSTYDEFTGGHLLIPILLAEHWPSLRYNNPKKSGLLTVKVRFKGQLPAALNVFVFAISSTSLTINRNRSVFVAGTQ